MLRLTLRLSLRRLALLATALCLLPEMAAGQTSPRASPPLYRGVQTRVHGVFITPIPGSPFTGHVDISSQEILPDGQTQTRTTINLIARDSSGRIHNERRRLVPQDFSGEPVLLETHIYDPATRLSVDLDPFTHIAREIVLRRAPTAPQQGQPATPSSRTIPGTTEKDLGEKSFNGINLHGLLRSRTIAADQNGTGKPVTIVDEYWYSPELAINILVKHDDPRTGEQIVSVTQIDRREPDAALFSVPATFKIADETPVP
jgi:hypothetical protein